MSKLFKNNLEKRIKEAAQAYYTDGTSNISDAEFDKLESELRELDPDSEVLKTGFGYSVEKDTTCGNKEPHVYGEVGSLPKVHNWNDTPKFFKETYVDASLKLDGLSVVLYYTDGVFQKALTRGDGKIGINITDKVSAILSLSEKTLTHKITCGIRGEILLPFTKFEIFKQAHPDMKNPRNSAAGLINQKDWSLYDMTFLNICVYQIIGISGSTLDIDLNRNAIYDFLHENFQHVVPHKPIYLYQDEMTDCMNALRDDWYNDYPADGIVLTQYKLNTVSSRSNEYHIGYNAVAYKFPPEEKVTTVEDVEWNCSKTGYFIPRVRVSPVELAGTTVQYATGFNTEFMVQNGIDVGAEVVISKMGEIIPNIVRVVKPVEVHLLTTCPECGDILVRNGVHLQCTNPYCPNAIIQDTLVWINTISPWDGLGDTVIRMWLEHYLGKDNLSIEALMACDCLAKPNDTAIIRNRFIDMWNNLHTCKISLATALQALNIPRIGDKTSKVLATHPSVIRETLKMTDGSHIVSTLRCVGIGEADALSYASSLPKMRRLRLIEDRIDWSEPSIREMTKVAITGKLSTKRADFEKLIADKGFVAGSISKDTKFLITDDPESSSEKNRKADAWGITKISEADFVANYINI